MTGRADGWATFRSAEEIARFQGANEISSQHLLLALMRDDRSRWSAILEERGVGRYERLPKSVGPLPPAAAAAASVAAPAERRYAKPMRRLIVDFLIACMFLLLALLRRGERRADPPALRLGLDAQIVLKAARKLAGGVATDGHVLVALASLPGSQIKLLRREHRVVAAAVRRELGISRSRDRAIVLLHEPALRWHRAEARYRAGSWSKLLFAVMRAVDATWALIVFTLDTAATAALYLVLWPAVLLANGLRALVGSVLHVPFTVRRGHEAPGGEMEVQPSPATSDVRVAIAVLAPRVLCFLVCVASALVLFWQTRRLGVEPFAISLARYDSFQDQGDLAPLLAPALVLFDLLFHYGMLVGAGILAGLGAGVLAVPTRREMQLVRLAGGHDVGDGSLILRIVLAPLALATAVFAFFEAILPFKGGPLYLTMYAIPVILAFACAAPLQGLLPY